MSVVDYVLSILSQLHRTPKAGNVGCRLRPFNSFLVASKRTQPISVNRVLFVRLFQFFPSCIRQALSQASSRRESPFNSFLVASKTIFLFFQAWFKPFNSFLVASYTGSRILVYSHLALSILSQLHPGSVNLELHLGELSFNSFLVASAFKMTSGSLLFLENFQFFPSCIYPLGCENSFMFYPPIFQFFPSCIEGSFGKSNKTTFPLSILSQLHLHYCKVFQGSLQLPHAFNSFLVASKGRAWTVSKTRAMTFNSFLVASVFTIPRVEFRLPHAFQFFPSCIISPT